MFFTAPRCRHAVAGVALVLAGCSSSVGGGYETLDERPSDESVESGELASLSMIVTRIVDGDSLKVVFEGEQDELRLVGINAPESSQCGGPEAKTALEAVLFPEGVPDQRSFSLVIDADEPRDRFGRLLANVNSGGQDVAQSLAADGFVIPLGGSASELHEFAREASRQQLGVWDSARCGPTIRGLEIESFVPNPAGPDDLPGAGEFIELRNELDTDLDLEGWVVHDESTSNRFVFSAATVPAGERFRLYSTCGVGTSDADFFMCDSDSVWNNSGDTAFVVDPNGNIVDFRFSP